MPWGQNSLLWLSTLLAVSGLSGVARAQSCEGPRPTDTSAMGGLSYRGAEVEHFDSSSGRARVHYARAGAHAPPATSTLEPGVPDAVVTAAQAADDALARYQELGYREPLGDGDSPCSSNGDSDAIDIYMLDFAAADGQVTLDHCTSEAPRRCAGFVLIDNDFSAGSYASSAEGVRTVVPHELFHLVQDSYDADVERWWAEGSAQWAAKQVYPELQDLERFLPAYFANPWRPLNVPPSGVVTDFLYATAIWPVFLEERYTPTLMRQIYEELATATTKVLPATDRALQARGSNLAEAYLQFAAYNAATGSRAPSRGGYVAAARYPEVDFEPLPRTQGELVSEVTSGLSAFYYHLAVSAPTSLSLDADPARLAATLLPISDGRAALDDATPLPSVLNGEGVVIVAGQSLQNTDAPFKLNGKDEASAAGDAAESASCVIQRGAAPKSGRWLGFVCILVGRWRASRRGKTRRF